MSSSETVKGLVLGLILGAGGTYAVTTYVLVPDDPCRDLCGEGTACSAGRCELEAPEAELEDEVDPDADADAGGKRKRGKRRRGKRGAGSDGADEGGEGAGLGGPPIDDDSKVPRFDPNKDQSISMSDGSERLSDSVVNRELAKLDPTFHACVRDAAARVDDLGRGQVNYTLGIAGSGKVVGVNASAPANLKDAGLIPCVRKAVYGHKFPAFNGPQMTVRSSFSVD